MLRVRPQRTPTKLSCNWRLRQTRDRSIGRVSQDADWRNRSTSSKHLVWHDRVLVRKRFSDA